MESTLNTAYSVLPTLSRDELKQLQNRIAAMLQDQDDAPADLFLPLSVAELEKELDGALAEFDSGNGYGAEQMCISIRKQFGWNRQ